MGTNTTEDAVKISKSSKEIFLMLTWTYESQRAMVSKGRIMWSPHLNLIWFEYRVYICTISDKSWRKKWGQGFRSAMGHWHWLVDHKLKSVRGRCKDNIKKGVTGKKSIQLWLIGAPVTYSCNFKDYVSDHV